MKIIAIATATLITHISHYTVTEIKQPQRQNIMVKEHLITPKSDKGFNKLIR